MVVEDYSFGRIKVFGRVYTRDVVVGPAAVLIENWWRREGHALYLDDLRSVLEEVKPTTLVVGTGYFGAVKIKGDLLEYCSSRGIKLLASRTQDAVKKFNELVEKGEKVVGAFHLTC